MMNLHRCDPPPAPLGRTVTFETFTPTHNGLGFDFEVNPDNRQMVHAMIDNFFDKSGRLPNETVIAIKISDGADPVIGA